MKHQLSTRTYGFQNNIFHDVTHRFYQYCHKAKSYFLAVYTALSRGQPKAKQLKYIQHGASFFLCLFLVCTNLYCISLKSCIAAKQILFVSYVILKKKGADHFQPVFIFQFYSPHYSLQKHLRGKFLNSIQNQFLQNLSLNWGRSRNIWRIIIAFSFQCMFQCR